MTLVFDFDGVIVRNSEFTKFNAWNAVFANDPQRVAAVRRLSEKYAGGKGDRHAILADMFREEGVAEDVADLVAAYAERFDEVVQAGILAEGVLPENRTGLIRLSTKHKLYVNSATPEEKIRKTVVNLRIGEFFAGVYGMPSRKIENLKRAAEDSGVSVSEIVFVGDGDGDRAAATAAGCRFIGVANNWNRWDDCRPFPIVRSLGDIEALI